MTMIVAPASSSRVEHAGRCGHVERVQAGGRLVEDIQCAALAAAQPAGDPQPLRLAAGQGWGGLAEPQVTQADLIDGPQRRGDRARSANRSRASCTLRPSTSAMVRPSIRTARVALLKRAPWQVGHWTVMSGRQAEGEEQLDGGE